MYRTVAIRLGSFSVLVSIAVVAGCTAVITGDPLADHPGGTELGTPGAGGAAAGGSGLPDTSGTSGTSGIVAAPTDLPCAVQSMLAKKCQVCHRGTPPGPLLTSADFRVPSASDPTKTVAQEALERVEAVGTERMPPAPFEAATADEIVALRAWVSSGAPATACSTVVTTAPDPYDTPVVCTSMTNWTGGNRESPLMRPGGACINCHTEERRGPTLVLGGTVYPTPHEPDDCNGVGSTAGAQVVITDANGVEFAIDVNEAGNFYREGTSFAYPYHAKLVYQGRERVMVEAQDDGDCNKCHTTAGNDEAPGRIFLP